MTDKNNAMKLWSQICNVMQPDMTSFSFDVWLKVLSPLTIKDDSLFLVAPTEMVKNTVANNYSEILLEYAKLVEPLLLDVKIIMADEVGYYMTDPDRVDPSALNPKYTFSTFIVGGSNTFAHAACQAVALKPAGAYNPLFLYGGVGLGKTHLMHAIGHEMRKRNPSAKVMYVTSETFTNELIQSISSNRNKEFRQKFRNVDLLLIDDIQFIANKEGVQEEFFHTFNTLYNADKQIIISSDKPPKEIAQLEERLKTRFEQGLIADVQQPDYETRMAILGCKAGDLELDKGVLEFIAERVRSNIRELEGSLTRVIAYCQLYRRRITVENTMEALKDLLPEEARPPLSVDSIKNIVAEFYNIDPSALDAKRRDQEIAFPRQVAMHLSRTMLDLPLSKIGDSFGGRNHTTVMHADEKIGEMLRSDPSFRNVVEDMKKRLRG